MVAEAGEVERADIFHGWRAVGWREDGGRLVPRWMESSRKEGGRFQSPRKVGGWSHSSRMEGVRFPCSGSGVNFIALELFPRMMEDGGGGCMKGEGEWHGPAIQIARYKAPSRICYSFPTIGHRRPMLT